MGKCESCGKPTKTAKDGTDYRKCWDCSQKAKAAKEELPVQSAQEKVAEICAVFKMCQEWMQKEYPKADADLGFQTAMHLSNQYWKNDRTPR